LIVVVLRLATRLRCSFSDVFPLVVDVQIVDIGSITVRRGGDFRFVTFPQLAQPAVKLVVDLDIVLEPAALGRGAIAIFSRLSAAIAIAATLAVAPGCARFALAV
jgi:hypothetical protein